MSKNSPKDDFIDAAMELGLQGSLEALVDYAHSIAQVEFEISTQAGKSEQEIDAIVQKYIHFARKIRELAEKVSKYETEQDSKDSSDQ
jgi:hypothetical protein